MKQYHVYIMSSLSRTLYIGVTGALERRVAEHKQQIGSSFASRYNVTRLVYVETFSDVRAAIAREKQIKNWSRAKKVELINAANPGWADLSAGWF